MAGAGALAAVTRLPADQPLVPSLLDRLMSGDASGTRAGAGQRRYTVNQLKSALRRDLEDLLNSHQRAAAAPPDLAALGRSIFDYGIPDLTDVELSSAAQVEAFRARLESAILQFDPRFRRVDVQVEKADPLDHTLRFRIDAVVFVHPAEEELVLHSYLEPTTRRFAFSGSNA